MGGLAQEDADHVRDVDHRAPPRCAAVPFAGFFSKDEIIDNAGHNGYAVFMIVGLVGAFLTAAYMTRATYLTFFGEPRGAAAGTEEHHARTSSPSAAPSRPSRPDAHRAASTVEEVPADAWPARCPRRRGADGRPRPTPATARAHRRTTPTATTPTTPRRSPAPIALGPHDSPAAASAVPLDRSSAVGSPSSPGYLNAAAVRSIEKFDASGSSAGRAGELLPASSSHADVQVGPTRCRRSLLVARRPRRRPGRLRRAATATRSSPARRAHRAQPAAARRATRSWSTSTTSTTSTRRSSSTASPTRSPGRRTGSTRTSSTASSTASASAAREAGDWVYRNIDQRVVDGAVNGTGAVAEGTGEALQPVQSGKVSQYGALLFGAAAIGALVLVIVNVLEEPHGCTSPTNNWLLSVGTFLPLAGVLVMLFIPQRARSRCIKQRRPRHRRWPRSAVGIVTLAKFDYDQAGKLQFFADHRRGSTPIHSRLHRSASTASACRCTSCRWSSPCW